MADISNSPHPSLSSFTYRTEFSHLHLHIFRLPSLSHHLFRFFFTPETAPLYSIHMVYSLRSHHSVDNHLIITNVEADNHISNRWDCKLVHSIRIPACPFTFWFILVCFLFYRVLSVLKFYCSFQQ